MSLIRDAWREGRPALLGWLSIDSALSAEALSHCGYDALVVDLQHGAADFAAAVHMFRAIEAGRAEPLVRLERNEAAEIMKLLDFGAAGVIAPLVESAREARAVVSAMQYPPTGTRSWGPRRPLLRHGPDYWRIAQDTVVALAMIETRRGLEGVADILEVAGLDGVFIGPVDLAFSLAGAPSGARVEQVAEQAALRVLQAAHEAGKRAGKFCATVERALEAVEQGFDVIALAPDLPTLTAAASATVKATRAKIAERAR